MCNLGGNYILGQNDDTVICWLHILSLTFTVYVAAVGYEPTVTCFNSGLWPSHCYSHSFVIVAEGEVMFLPQPAQSILEQQAWEVIKWKRLNLPGEGAFSSLTQQVTTATRQWKIICQLVRLTAEVCCSVGFIRLCSTF